MSDRWFYRLGRGVRELWRGFKIHYAVSAVAVTAVIASSIFFPVSSAPFHPAPAASDLPPPLALPPSGVSFRDELAKARVEIDRLKRAAGKAEAERSALQHDVKFCRQDKNDLLKECQAVIAEWKAHCRHQAR